MDHARFPDVLDGVWRGSGAGSTSGFQSWAGPVSAGQRAFGEAPTGLASGRHGNPRAHGWWAGPAAPALLAPTVQLAFTAFSGFGLFELASTPQIPCNPSPRGSLPTHCANAFLSLSQLAPTISTDTCSPPSGTSHSPARPASSCLVSQARIALTVLLVPLTPRAPSLLSQNILVYPSASRYPKSTVCPL